MTEFRTILAVVGDDDHSWASVATAAALASRTGAQLHVVAVARRLPVVETFTPDSIASEVYLDAIADAREARAREYLGAAGRPDATVHVEKGDLAASVALVAEESRADLVVLGSSSEGISRSMAASTSARIVHITSCAVLVTPEARSQPYARILVGADLLDSGGRPIEVAAGLARAEGAAFRSLFVHEPVPLLDEMETIDTHAMLEQARSRLDAQVAELGLPESAGAEAVLREGHAGSQILAEAREWEADLVVMGSHRITLLERLLLGSSAHHVLHHSSRATLLVPYHGVER